MDVWLANLVTYFNPLAVLQFLVAAWVPRGGGVNFLRIGNYDPPLRIFSYLEIV